MKRLILKLLLPNWLLEMAEQIATQPSRSTAHPFWQVRCKRYIVTEQGYNDHHFELVDDEGVFYRDGIDECEANEAILDRVEDFCSEWANFTGEDFLDMFDIDSDGLPPNVSKVYMQEVEEVVSTHLTQSDAEWFIKRKQHDYPALYTYVASAYWSPQIKRLQDWLIALI
ncbi:MAG: hypothetical protein K6L81_01750 [Agarilytica sp.]